MDKFSKSPALDAALIAAAQKVEHYEIASYGSLRAYAEQLKFDGIADKLQSTKAAAKNKVLFQSKYQ